MNISIEKAKQIREDIGATHLILLVRGADGSENVSTHGENEQQANEAASAGNRLKQLLGWPENLCQSTPQQREEWNRKTVPEIRADIERLLRQQQRNESEREARLNEYASSRDSQKRDNLLREYIKVGRLNEDYFVRIQALDWVLNGAPTAAPSEPVVVYQWVGLPDVAAFEHYIEHYHDQQDEALDEAAREHYQEWLDTREPSDQYVVSENDHSLDPIEPSFEVVHIDKSEFGHHYQLTFPRTAAALHFGLGWGKLEQAANKPVLSEREQQAIDNINAALNADDEGRSWSDCGEMDAEVLLSLVARLTTKPEPQS